LRIGTAEVSKSLPNWRSVADLTDDKKVDANNLEVFVLYWLSNEPCIPSDLDRSRSVDFYDFAIFAENWLWQ
jgi:hypothetical protein